jgi:FkbM family methyltransferase
MHTNFINYEKFQSNSSYGEDAILNGVFKRLSWIMQENLFESKTYIDIGAFHPVKESNTYFLYQKGWYGTLIEPNSYMNVLTHEIRPNDILLNFAVDVEEGEKTLYIFGEVDSSNTLSKDFAERKRRAQGTDIGWTAQVQAYTINQIITKHVQYFNKTPFFLNIDVEGLDLDVISTYSHDVRIPFIMIEDETMESFFESPIKNIMAGKDYIPIAASFLSTLYLDKKSKYTKHLKKIGHLNDYQ